MRDVLLSARETQEQFYIYLILLLNLYGAFLPSHQIPISSFHHTLRIAPFFSIVTININRVNHFKTDTKIIFLRICKKISLQFSVVRIGKIYYTVNQLYCPKLVMEKLLSHFTFKPHPTEISYKSLTIKVMNI